LNPRTGTNTLTPIFKSKNILKNAVFDIKVSKHATQKEIQRKYMNFCKFDYNIQTYAAREELVNNNINENMEEITRYFEKTDINQDDKLSDELPVGKALSAMADYLLDCEQPQVRERDNATKNKSNYYLSKQQKITSQNCVQCKELMELQKDINKFKHIIREKKTKNQHDKYIIRQWINDLKDNQILIKNMVFKPIDFKHLMIGGYVEDSLFVPDRFELWTWLISEDNILDLFESSNWSKVLNLLQFYDKSFTYEMREKIKIYCFTCTKCNCYSTRYYI
jgi:hypothetical protein